MEVVQDSKEAATEPQIVAAYLKHSELELNRSNKRDAGAKLLEILTQVVGVGGRRCMRLKAVLILRVA